MIRIDRGGNFPRSVTGGRFVYTPPLCGHDFALLLDSNQWQQRAQRGGHVGRSRTENAIGPQLQNVSGLDYSNYRMIYSGSKVFLIRHQSESDYSSNLTQAICKLERLFTDRENVFVMFTSLTATSSPAENPHTRGNP